MLARSDQPEEQESDRSTAADRIPVTAPGLTTYAREWCAGVWLGLESGFVAVFRPTLPAPAPRREPPLSFERVLVLIGCVLAGIAIAALVSIGGHG